MARVAAARTERAEPCRGRRFGRRARYVIGITVSVLPITRGRTRPLVTVFGRVSAVSADRDAVCVA
jgi:hypothetical protein